MSKGVHRFALVLACFTFFLIIAGANVTSHDAGLAVPDWPLSFGKLLPEMVGNVFWEHGHRMVAATAGLICIGLAVYLQVREPRTWVKRLGWIMLGAFIVQGLFGGLTVRMRLPLAVSATHATLAQLIFTLTVSMVLFTSREWVTRTLTISEDSAAGISLRSMSLVSSIAVLVQIFLGAVLRHSVTWDYFLPTEWLVAHIAGAILTSVAVAVTAVTVLRRHRGDKFLTRPAGIALGLLFVQLMLGIAAYLTRAASPYDPQPLNPMITVTVSHVACGALVFATTIVLTLRVFRVLRAEQQSRDVGVLATA